ncbi:RNA polymerase sigma-70 factor, ECF subfamily [Pseudarcicella hirudinis]|uniref:RNA polymerase sigma-70 factor, ECF subfamily n=1 Tax=Pseudarcicella hirudinis TaxID=1079859 RepID=A0A1I5WKQ0_9BACT|nr:RNA polymerase sigma factor [Pseudarcicella hirudinis]SFQ20345.1 RNA polymerase sigma-70 factor, ECF subfamily [Pseudarcicella hirudinis]
MKILQIFSSEEHIVKACQQGDPKAQRRLYEKYSSKMMAVCYRYTSDEFDAEEVLIQGFMKVFEKVGTFKSEGSFEGWIRRIMVNEALMFLRQKKNFEISYDKILYEPEPEQFKTDLEVQDLLKLIEELPPGYRTVFNLYAIEGYSHAEIAKLLGITESTSKSQLSRARVLLQEKMHKKV